MNKLNLLKQTFKTYIKNNKIYIFCIIRKKYLILTPEEWVRQNFIYFLIKVKKYNIYNINVEYTISIYNLKKRLDIIIFKKKIPYILIECKRPYYKINQKIINKICIYHYFIQSSYIIITNGLLILIYFFNIKNKSFSLVKDFPNN